MGVSWPHDRCVAFSLYVVIQAFKRLDPDRSGFIEQGELVTVLKGVVDEQEVVELIKSADLVDSDGKVSQAEFISAVSILWNHSREASSASKRTSPAPTTSTTNAS